MRPMSPLRVPALLAVLAVFASSASAQKSVAPPPDPARVAALAARPDVGTCALGTASEVLSHDSSFRSASNTLRNDGTLFEDFPFYDAALWVGARVNGEVRFAGSMYGDAEFWPGPLEEDEAPTDCAEHDRIYVVTRDQIRSYNAGNSSASVSNWPHHLGAPVADGDGNPDNYNLAGGDRPALRGETMAWWVMNDAGNVKRSSLSPPLGLEVQVTAHSYTDGSTDPAPNAPSVEALDQTFYYKFTLVNRSSETMEDLRVGFWADPDLGDPTNDYVGVDTTLDLVYAYNGSVLPENGTEAVGITFIQDSAFLEHRTSLVSTMLRHDGGTGPMGTPVLSQGDGYAYLSGTWRDGSPVTFGGQGYGGDTPTQRMFPGLAEASRYWSEERATPGGDGSPFGDRRLVTSAAPSTLAPGQSRTLWIAVLRTEMINRISSLVMLKKLARYDRQVIQGLTPTPIAIVESLQYPTDRSPKYLEVVDTLSPTLSWSPVLGAEAYIVIVRRREESAKDIILVTTDTSVTLHDLLPGTEYPWYVLASAGPHRSYVQIPDVFITPGDTPPFEELPEVGFTGFLATANAAGPINPPIGAAADYVDFPAPGAWRATPEIQQVGEGAWFIHTGSNFTHSSFDDFLRRSLRNGMSAVIPFDYEMRFTPACHAAWLATVGTIAEPAADPYAYLGGLPDSAPEGACWAYDRYEYIGDDQPAIIVPFELWNIGIGTPDDPSDDVRLIPGVIDFDQNGFGLQPVDHQVSSRSDDPETDWTYWLQPLDSLSGAGSVGYDWWASQLLGGIDPGAHGSEILARIVLVNWNGGDVSAEPFAPDQDMPEPGTVLRITTTAPTPAYALVTPQNAPEARSETGVGAFTLTYDDGWRIDGSGQASGVTGVDVCSNATCARSTALAIQTTDSGFSVAAADNTDRAFPPLTEGIYYVRVRTQSHPEGALGGYLLPAGNLPPSAPKGLASQGLVTSESDSIRVTFAPATDSDETPVRYIWQASPDAAFPDALTFSSSTDEPRMTIPASDLFGFLGRRGFTAGEQTALYHRVFATDGSAVAVSETANLSLVVGTDLDESELPVALAIGGVFPNPLGGEGALAVDAPTALSLRMTIYDVLGRRISAETTTVSAGYGRRVPVRAERLAPGVYVYHLQTVGEGAAPWRATGRFVVAR